MIHRPISKLVSALLAVVALAHLARLLLGTHIEIGSWVVPAWASFAVVVILGGLALALWRESDRFIERRRQPRRRAIHLVSLKQSSAGDSGQVAVILGRTLALSPGGATVETSEPLEVGAEMDLELAVDAQIVEAHGTVVHVDPESEGRYSIGVEFSAEMLD